MRYSYIDTRRQSDFYDRLGFTKKSGGIIFTKGDCMPLPGTGGKDPHGIIPECRLKVFSEIFSVFAAIILTSPLWVCARIERFMGKSDDLFVSCGQFLSPFPGVIGIFLRRGYYWMTLDSFSRDCSVGFSTWFPIRSAKSAQESILAPGASSAYAISATMCLSAAMWIF